MHLTVRMAWHDNNWDGRICQDPKKNTYCVGNSSLLSDRLSRKRDLDFEVKNAGKKLDQLGDYLPPCYWSSNAFSVDAANIWHDHPWLPKKINDKLRKYSVFTWPFAISFTSSDEKKAWGRYPPESIITKRLNKLENNLISGDSLVFFYLNYSNPISDDSGQYALVGCAPLVNISRAGKFDLNDEELQKNRAGDRKNFSDLNWTIQVSYDFGKSGVLLPYKDYLEHIDRHPSDEHLLNDVSVLIDTEMSANFKYVAMGMNDDAGIYLLTKLRKSLLKIGEYGIPPDASKVDLQCERVERLLRKAWEKRGLYPGLGSVLDVLGDMNREDYGKGNEIVSVIKNNSDPEDGVDIAFSIITGETDIPKYLKSYDNILNEIRVNVSEDYDINLLKKLSLFSLTPTQIRNILDENGIRATSDEIISNPYILCEEYEPPDQVQYTDDKTSIDDAGIPLFMIDIGMFPDSRFLGRNPKLQNMKPNAPQRIRAIIRDYLKSQGANGDCLAPLDDVLEYIREHPLFFKEQLTINKKQLVSESGRYADHFEGNIVIKHNNDRDYFYLKEIHDAEQRISKGIRALLKREDYEFNNASSIDLTADVAELSGKIKNFPKDDFVKERQHLTKDILSKSLYVVTGIPGSGKTKALEVIIDMLKNMGEDVTLLAPTGKAALRLGNGAKTVDKLIYECKYNDILYNLRKCVEDTRSRPNIENLIIDESSMLDLTKLDVLFRMITDSKGNITAKRVVFVGDPNQLPPIGYGKPFYDIIQMIRKESHDSNYTKLLVNCRQSDPEIIDIASIFEYGKDDYDAGRLARIASGNYTSSRFKSISWRGDEDLEAKIDARLNDLFDEILQTQSSKAANLNLLLGLDGNGYVDKRDPTTMKLDRFQILCPYKNRGSGATGHLNYYIQKEYRESDRYRQDGRYYKNTSFVHSDKIISTSNKKDKGGNISIANGSIGVINIDTRRYKGEKRIFFSDGTAYSSRRYRDYLPVPIDEYEPAYAITVHKSQGSEFEHTFVVIPQRKALLSKELIYTALTRAKKNVTLFVQEAQDDDDSGQNILDYACHRSDIKRRLTSTFSAPTDSDRKLEPEKGVFVRSKIEYILYTKLKESGIEFEYERKIKCKAYGQDRDIEIQPDFTLTVNGTEYYLEHLGMLDDDRYRAKWRRKLKTYKINGLADRLVTTDDLHGIQDECIDRLLKDVANQRLAVTKSNPYSLHHYKTYH